MQYDDRQDPVDEDQAALPFNTEQTALPFDGAEQARAAEQPAAAMPVESRPEPRADRCDSCGGSAVGNLCARCEETFQPMLDRSPSALSAMPSSQLDEIFAALENAAPRPTAQPAPVLEPLPVASVDEPRAEIRTIAIKAEPPKIEAVQPEAAAVDTSTPHATSLDAHSIEAPKQIEVQQVEVHKVEAPTIDVAKMEAKNVVAFVEPAKHEPTTEPVLVGAALAPAGSSRTKYLAAAAAVIAVAAIGIPLGTLWLGREAPAVASAAPAPRPKPSAAKPAVAPVEPTPALEPVPAPAPVAAPPPAVTPAPAPVAPKPALVAKRTPPARVPPKPVRTVKPPTPAPLPVGPAIETGALVVPASSAVTAVAPPPPPVVEPPMGPFYESTAVDTAPQLASSVEPRIPDSLQGKNLREIVVIRVLVSQTGRPVLVNVLRRSKAGVALDDAVVAAVKKSTFTPATKRGRAVSAYMQMGVPIE